MATSNRAAKTLASHDLQEPLRSVMGFMELLRKQYQDRLDAKAEESIGFAIEGTRRMQALIQDLLAYSRVGTRARDLEPVDAN